MNIRILSFLILLFCVQSVRAELPAQCGILKQQFEQEVETQRKLAKEELTSVNSDYVKVITEQLAANQEAGNLDEVLFLKSELEKAANGQPLNTEVVPKLLKPYRRKYHSEVREIRSIFDQRARDAQVKLVEELKALEKTETRANRIASAVAVKEFREGIQKKQPPRMLDTELISRIEGIWQITFPNGAKAVLQVSGSGAAKQADDETRLSDAADVELKIVPMTKTPTVIFDNGLILNRYTLTNANSMLIEQWYPSDRFPNSPSYNGTATRIR